MKNVIVIGCSHSCGLNLYYKYKKEVYDRDLGWVASLSKLLPEYNITSYAIPGTGFNLHDMLLDQALLKKPDLIILQLTSRRYVFPLKQFVPLTIKSTINNLKHITYDLSNCLSIKFENDNLIMLNEELLGKYSSKQISSFNTLLSSTDDVFLNEAYSTFLHKIRKLELAGQVAIVNFGGTSKDVLQKHNITDYSCLDSCLNYLQSHYRLNANQAFKMYNNLTEKHMSHMTLEMQTYILEDIIIKHPLIQNIL